MKKQILINLISLSSILTMNAQNGAWTPATNILWTNSSVGIGISPSAQLDIAGQYGGVNNRNFRVKFFQNGDAYIGGAELSGIAHVNGYWTALYAKQGNATSAAFFDGKVGFGLPNPTAQLDISGQLGGTNSRNFRVRFNQNDDPFIGGAELSGITHVNGYWTALYAKQGNATSAAIFDGKVGIGVTSPSYSLDVCGTIRAQEVKVDLQGTCVPDFVFKNDYKLMDLNTLEKFVKTNQHLPEISPEKEMIENGLNIKEFQMKLLQKMEEMTLYVIEQNKRLKLQSDKNEKQEQELKILKAKIKKIESIKR